MPDKGFGDGLPLSKAYPGSEGFRNTPTLINAAHKAAWFHDGRLGTNLNDVTREMITETYIMNMDMRLMQERLKQDPVYVAMFKDAGYGEPSNGSVRKAIPEYLKTLTSRGAPFDAGTMFDAARNGFELFKGKAGCAACHSGPRFTDDRAHNTAVPDNPDIWSDPRRHVTFVTYAIFLGVENYMNLRRDPGAHVRTHKSDGEIGPNLAGIADKGLKFISDSILQPAKTITPGFETYVVIDRKGRKTTGVKTRDEADEIDITKANGEVVTIAKPDIKETAQDPITSVMPDDLSEAMTVKDYQDVLSFLLLQKGE